MTSRLISMWENLGSANNDAGYESFKEKQERLKKEREEAERIEREKKEKEREERLVLERKKKLEELKASPVVSDCLDVIDEVINDRDLGRNFVQAYHLFYEIIKIDAGLIIYEELVTRLEGIILDYITPLQDNKLILTDLVRHFEESSEIIFDLFLYVEHILLTNNTGIVPLKDKAKDILIEKVVNNREIMDQCDELVTQFLNDERDGAEIDRGFVSGCTQVYLDHRTMKYYVPFEEKIISSTKAFYLKESEKLVSELEVLPYFEHASNRLNEENERATTMFHESSAPKIADAVVSAMITAQLDSLLSAEKSVRYCIENNCVEDLKNMYNSLSLSEEGFSRFLGTLRDVIIEEGTEIIADEVNLRDPASFIESLMTLREKYENILVTACRTDNSVQTTITLAFRNFLNTSEASGDCIAEYAHNQQRTTFKRLDQEEIDRIIKNITIIYGMIDNVKYVDSLFRNRLSLRLIRGWSDLNQEKALLKQLENVRGLQVTYTMSRMIDDLTTSKELHQVFSENREADSTVSFSALVLSRHMWPTQRPCTCRLPPILQESLDAYQQFYTEREEKKFLTWQPNLGVSIVASNLGGKEYIIKMNTYQMVILELFNDSDSLTFDQISNTVLISNSQLELEVFLLLKYNLIKKDANSDKLSLNDSFSVKSKAFEIVPLSMGDMNQKRKQLRLLDSYRRDLVEASIVRILKRNSSMSKTDLLTAVVENLRGQFDPNEQVIEGRLRVLSEQNYIELKEGQFHYVP